MRNWNTRLIAIPIKTLKVYSLPMRNWNQQYQINRLSAYLVYSLPMRNWNHCWLDGCYDYEHTFIAYLWGIETCDRLSAWCKTWLFIAYLWGIETCILWELVNLVSWFIAYLWGIETRSFLTKFTRSTPFIAYLWGIETIHICHTAIGHKRVYSLPMRNWNLNMVLMAFLGILCL